MTQRLNIPHRPRRLRHSGWMRRMVAETALRVEDLIWPVFVQEGSKQATPIASLPGVFRYSIDLLCDEVTKAAKLGIPAIALFPVTDPQLKTPDGKEALNDQNLICRAVRAIKALNLDIGIITDVALDPYTSHGHDGLVDALTGYVVNDDTVKILCKQAVAQAKAGADIIAPSDMMDGRIGAIREALDDAGFEQVAILSYAVKYASAFYGPFREAVGSSANLGKAGKETYQMNPAGDHAEALREVTLDVAEGADMVMVKPGMPYLDVIVRVKDATHLPVLAYQVSGEYAMLKAAGGHGWIDEKRTTIESLIAFKRAGASAILTYAARDVAEWLSH